MKIFFLILVINIFIKSSKQRSLGFNVCQHLPYDFYNIPGSRDFFFLRYEYLDFYGARDFCMKQGMNLPPILNEDQNNLIYSFIERSKYASYYTSGLSLGVSNNMWLTGDPFTYARFDSNQNNNTVLDIHIVIASKTGNWLKVPCNFVTGVICHVRC